MSNLKKPEKKEINRFKTGLIDCDLAYNQAISDMTAWVVQELEEMKPEYNIVTPNKNHQGYYDLCWSEWITKYNTLIKKVKV